MFLLLYRSKKQSCSTEEGAASNFTTYRKGFIPLKKAQIGIKVEITFKSRSSTDLGH